MLTPGVMPFGFSMTPYVAHGNYVVLESHEGDEYQWHVVRDDIDLDNYLTSKVSKFKEQHSLKSAYCSFLFHVFRKFPVLELARKLRKFSSSNLTSGATQNWNMTPVVRSIDLRAVP